MTWLNLSSWPLALPTSRDADRPLRETAKMRLLFLWGLLCLGLSVISARLIYLSTGHSDEEGVVLASSPASPCTSRANIVDCRGEILATSLRTASLYMNAQDLTNPEEAVQKLHKVFPDLNIPKLQQKIQEGRRFIWIKRHLTPTQHYTVLKCGIPGVYVQRDEKRVYPQGPLVSHLLGLTNVDHEGIAGIEKGTDTALRTSPEALHLTIDLRIQNALRHVLVASLAEFQASGALGVVMDVHSGAIRAMVSLPDYDLNQPHAADPSCLLNKATTGVWEMGSTFKALTMAMALEHGCASFKSQYDATQPLRVGRFKITDFQPKNRWLSLPEVFVHSSNIGTARVALEAGTHVQQAFLKKMGLLEPLHLEIPETAKPLVPARWTEATTMTVSYGYGLSVTPVQLLSSIACLVNGGTLYAPTLLASKASSPSSRHVLSPEVSLKMRQLLRMVVLEGSGKRAHIPGFGVIGKTGTAYTQENGRYKKESVRTTFVGAFPASKPQYALLVMLEDPHATPRTYGFRTAGWNAAVVGGRMIERMITILNLAPGDDASFDQRLPLHLFQKPQFVHVVNHRAAG